MGADAFMGWCDLPSADINTAEAIARLTDETLANVYEVWTGIDILEPDEPTSADWQSKTKARLVEAFEALTGRSVATLDIYGFQVCVAGGMSWGEIPEGMDDVMMVAASGIGQKR